MTFFKKNLPHDNYINEHVLMTCSHDKTHSEDETRRQW